MKSRKLRMLLTMLATLVIVSGGTPAPAADAAGSGEVLGSVTTSPGVPLTPTTTPTCGPTPVVGKPFVAIPAPNGAFSFLPTNITGAITATDNTNPQNTVTFAGPVTVTASGSACDTAAFGVGRVGALSGSGSTSAGGVTTSITVALNNNNNGSTLASNPPNTFVRVGGTVEVWLKLNAALRLTVNGTTRTVSATLCVKVTAEFVPTATNGTHVTGAIFTGTWNAVGGVSPACNKKP